LIEVAGAEIVSAMTVNQRRAKRFTALDKHQPDRRVVPIQPDPVSHSLRSESRLALGAVARGDRRSGYGYAPG